MILKVLQLCIRKLRSHPSKAMDMNLLCNDPDIKEKKKGAIAKFLEWIHTHPETFEVRQNARNFEIALVTR
jgi:hypothetical protein